MYHEIPEEFEVIVDTGIDRPHYSNEMQKESSRILDNLFLFIDKTEQDDVLKVSCSASCPHFSYEKQRLVKGMKALNDVKDTWNRDGTLTTSERESAKFKCQLSFDQNFRLGSTPF